MTSIYLKCRTATAAFGDPIGSKQFLPIIRGTDDVLCDTKSNGLYYHTPWNGYVCMNTMYSPKHFLSFLDTQEDLIYLPPFILLNCCEYF